MLFGYEIKLNGMDNFSPTAVSGVNPVKLYAPAGTKDVSEYFKAYSVVVSYPGDLMKAGNVKRKLTFQPNNKIGMVGYNRKNNVTDIQYLFGFKKDFFAEDAYLAASTFASIMSCRIMNGKVKKK